MSFGADDAVHAAILPQPGEGYPSPMTVTEQPTKTIDGVELTPKQVSLRAPRCSPRSRRSASTASRSSPAPCASSVASVSARASPATSPSAIPEFPDHFWVNPFGLSFRQIRVSDLILVNHDGDVVYGDQPVNRAAFVIHSAIHGARPDVVAAAHSHSPYGKSFASLGIPLAPLTQDACIFYEDHTVITEQGGAVVFEIEAGKQLAAAFPTGKAAIHQNHGLFTVGQTVDEAVFWFVSMERSCQAQLMAMAAGEPKHIRHEFAFVHRPADGVPARRLVQLPAALAGDLSHRSELFE